MHVPATATETAIAHVGTWTACSFACMQDVYAGYVYGMCMRDVMYAGTCVIYRTLGIMRW